MQAIKNMYVIISLLVLMILRLFAVGEWMGSIAIAGLLISWLDTIHQIWQSNKKLITTRQKRRYAIALSIMSFVGAILLILMIINFIIGIKWLNTALVLDEITLLSLLICLSQKTIVKVSNSIINKE